MLESMKGCAVLTNTVFHCRSKKFFMIGVIMVLSHRRWSLKIPTVNFEVHTGDALVDVGCVGVTQFRWKTFPVPQRVATNLFVDKVDHCTLELQMETEVNLARF